MSFADEYALLEAFLQANPGYARLNDECIRLQNIVNQKDEAGNKATYDYEKWSCCEEEMDCLVINSLSTSSDLHCEHLRSGQILFERIKREAMIVAGEAFKHWVEATDQLVVAKSNRQTCRSALVETWNEIKHLNSLDAAEKEQEVAE